VVVCSIWVCHDKSEQVRSRAEPFTNPNKLTSTMFIPPLSRGKVSISFGQVRPHPCSYLLESNNVQDSSLVMGTLYSKMSLETNNNLESGLLLRGMDLTILRRFRQTI
jgi:hypothetical protein